MAACVEGVLQAANADALAQIELDLHRTFPDHPGFNLKKVPSRPPQEWAAKSAPRQRQSLVSGRADLGSTRGPQKPPLLQTPRPALSQADSGDLRPLQAQAASGPSSKRGSRVAPTA